MHESDPNGNGDSPDEHFDWHAEVNDSGATEHDQTYAHDAYPPIDEAFLPTDEAIGDSMEATDDISPEAVRARCIDKVKLGLAEIYGRMTSTEQVGHVDSEYIDDIYMHGAPIGGIVSGLAQEAAIRDDPEETAQHIDMILGMQGGVDRGEIIKACYAGVTVGNERAFGVLRSELQQEKNTTAHILEMRRTRQSYTSRPVIEAKSMHALIDAAKEQGTPPDAWIDEYSIDDEQKWELTVRYLAHVAADPGDDQPERQMAVDAKIAELSSATADHVFAFSHARTALRLAKDIDVRLAVADRAIAVVSFGNIPLNGDSFDDLLKMGVAIVEDPVLATQVRITALERVIEQGADLLLTNRLAEPYDLIDLQMNWRVAVKQHAGASPDELIELINLQTSQMLAGVTETIDGQQDHGYHEELAIINRDAIIRRLAERAADTNDFVAVRRFIAAVSSSNEQESITAALLPKAQTSEQVQAIRPDEMTLEYSPWLKLQFDHADELVSGDVSAMTARAMSYAGTMNVEPGAKREFIARVHSTLAAQDEQRMRSAAAVGEPYEPRAPLYARQILPMLRAAGEGFDETFYLSDALILAGDPDESQRIYEDIASTGFTPIGRLTRFWILAQTINKRQT